MRRFLPLYVGLAGLLALLAGAAAAAEALTPSPLEELIVPHLDWSPCSEGSEFACARAQVPLDYSDPGRRTIELALIKRAATDPGRRIGTLFFNPGGPSNAGTLGLPQVYRFFPREVRERFDIVSWDPRGVGESTAVRCFDSAEEAIAWEASIPTGFPVGRKERAFWVTEWAALSQRCQERDPELPRYVSTADTARELDLLRQAVGDAQLTYLGISLRDLPGRDLCQPLPRPCSRVDPRRQRRPGGVHECGRRPPTPPQHRPAIGRWTSSSNTVATPPSNGARSPPGTRARPGESSIG